MFHHTTVCDYIMNVSNLQRSVNKNYLATLYCKYMHECTLHKRYNIVYVTEVNNNTVRINWSKPDLCIICNIYII